MTAAPPPGAGKGQLLVRVSLVNLFFVVVAIGATLWSSVREQGLRAEHARLTAARVDRCAPKDVAPVAPDAEPELPEAPPEDAPKSGYIGDSGIDILPAMRVRLEALRAGRGPDDPTETLMFGSPEVLPPSTIHVVNLWATWCSPCLAELPDFKAMFERRRDWDNVRFVPIQVKDIASPLTSYRDKADIMPGAPFRLADRGMNDPLVTALTADEQRKLFKDNLPVTLILDCNRRVRWAQFNQLTEADFKDLEATIDRFRDEIKDTSPGAWCRQEWPGNGRCEGLENTAKFHSLEDCGELKKPTDNTAPVVTPPVGPCGAGKIRTVDGKCARKLHGEYASQPLKPKVPTCGNAKCDAGESSNDCCLDCGCDAPLVCRSTREGTSKCMVKGLKM